MHGPGFLTGGAAAGGVLLLATGGAAALGCAEWRRPDQRRRAARVGATLAAVGALAWLALRPGFRSGDEAPGPPSGVEVALWTGGPRPTDEAEILRGVPLNLRFRLPGAEAPEGTRTVPDAAALPRHVSRTGGTLHLLGDGLEADDLAALAAPWRLAFHPGPDGAGPRFVAAHAPRVLRPGEPLSVAGQVRGGPPGGAPLSVVLEGPGSAPVAVPVAADGTFRVSVPGLPAPGRYGWRLRLVGAGEPVWEEENGGVSVAAPDLPRVLVLESSPHPDTAVLRRWLGAAGGTVTVRTEVGRGRFRFATDGNGSGEFLNVDAALLGRVDLVVTDVPALAGLTAPERDALRTAVAGATGVGVLVLGDSPPAPGRPDDDLPPADRAFFLPWRLEPTGEEENASEAAGAAARSTRLRWTGPTGEEAAPDAPVPVLPFRVVSGEVDGTVVLVRDGPGRAVTTRVARGRGRLGRTLTTDTGRWRREGQAGAFAAFWSGVLGDLAAAATVGEHGRWTLVGEAGTSPAASWVDGPATLRWQGGNDVDATHSRPGTATAEDAPAGEPPSPLPLAPDAVEPTRGNTRFWPRHAGWHRVQTPPDGPPLDFYVAAAGSWPGVHAAARRRDTARFVALAGGPRVPAASPDAPSHDPGGATGVARDSAAVAGALFVLFVAAAGFLWAERVGAVTFSRGGSPVEPSVPAGSSAG